MKIQTIIKKLKLSINNRRIVLNGLIVNKSEYNEKLNNGDELIIEDSKDGDIQKWCIKYINNKIHYIDPLQHYYMYC